MNTRATPNARPAYHYDKKSRRWRDQDGRIVLKSQVASGGDEAGDDSFGGLVETKKRIFKTPFSDASLKLENLIRGAENLEALITAQDKRIDEFPKDRGGNPVPRPSPIPSKVLAAYKLADWYLATEGDVFQHIQAPIEIALGSELDIIHKDRGVTRALKDLYGPTNIDLWGLFHQMWTSMGRYGVCYPLEVPEEVKPNGDARIRQVLLLPPRFMWVGYYVSPGTVAPDGTYGLAPFSEDPSERWTSEAAKSSFLPMTYNAFSPKWEEQIQTGWDIPIDGRRLYPIRSVGTLMYERYPAVPISRAYRQISTRVIFEELVRGTIEGWRNPLWLFLLDDDKSGKRPSRAEMNALGSALEAAAGERTGYMKWRGNLRVEIHAPKPLEQMLATDTWVNFTLSIFRQIGGSIRLLTGNVATPGRTEGTTLDVDLKVWLRRLEFMRTQISAWEQGARVRMTAHDKALQKRVPDASVKFSRSLLEISQIIQDELKPLYTIGLTSGRTTLDRAGYNFDNEVANKEAEQPIKDLLAPPPSFNQMTFGPGGGQSQQQFPSQQSPGRPSKAMEARIVNAVRAAFDDDEEKRQYLEAVLFAYNEMLKTQNVEAFIAQLRSLNSDWLGRITSSSFARISDVGEVSAATAAYAAEYVNSYIDNLQKDLLAAVAAGKDLSTFAYRVGLYPAEGFKAAFFNGQREAMGMRGARGWRRVLRPEATASGPCPMCVADSRITHAITEPFQVLHPNEACGAQEFYISYTTDQGESFLEIPVPGLMDEWTNMVSEILPGARTISRRKRA